ncbi:MAG: EF-hand domain-containing protein [Micavibrio sp.]
MTSVKTLLLGAFLTGALIAPALAQETDAAPAMDGKPPHEMKMPGKAFEESDADKDGALDVEEFLARHREKFKEIDTSGDGKISAEEFKTHTDAMREKYKGRREKMIEKMEERSGTGEKPAETDAKTAE